MINIEPIARPTEFGVVARAREVALRFLGHFTTRLQGIPTVAFPPEFNPEESIPLADGRAFLDRHFIVVID